MEDVILLLDEFDGHIHFRDDGSIVYLKCAKLRRDPISGGYSVIGFCRISPMSLGSREIVKYEDINISF